MIPTPPIGVSITHASDISEFRAAVSQSFVPLHVTAPHVDRFGGVIRGATVDDVQLIEVSATEHFVERTPELIARGDRAYFKLSLMLAGTAMLVQDEREAIIRPGDFAIYDTSRPYTLAFDDDFRTLVVMFPRHLVALPPELVGEMTAVRVSGSDGLGAVVTPYLAQLGDHLEQLTGPTGARLTHSALDLITTVFTHQLGVDNVVVPHRALMQRIRSYIETNLAKNDLGPTSIAAAHFISTRHLHGLFHEEGTTVSTWIRERRLDRCRRDLADPTLAGSSVAAIASRWGFVDAAHFSRSFRTAVGVAPSVYRANH
jgi:AraC-like DNA-binding protein